MSDSVYVLYCVLVVNLSVIFAGYNTSQPSQNLGDYRSIGRVQLNFPEGYLKSARDEDSDRKDR